MSDAEQAQEAAWERYVTFTAGLGASRQSFDHGYLAGIEVGREPGARLAAMLVVAEEENQLAEAEVAKLRLELEQVVATSTRTFEGYNDALERALGAETEIAKLRSHLLIYHSCVMSQHETELATEDAEGT